jgi:8-oxo-dGTP diphosphatase
MFESVGRVHMPVLRVVAGVVRRKERILAARRGPDMRHPGRWEFPGGKVREGESDRAALIRELREELGIDVEVHDFLAESLFQYPDQTVRLLGYWCDLGAQEPKCLEHDKVAWFNRLELSGLVWADADLPLVAKAREQLS